MRPVGEAGGGVAYAVAREKRSREIKQAWNYKYVLYRQNQSLNHYQFNQRCLSISNAANITLYNQ